LTRATSWSLHPQQIRKLRDTERAFYHEKWVKATIEDLLPKALAQDFLRLTRDLLLDGEGNLQFKKNLLMSGVSFYLHS